MADGATSRVAPARPTVRVGGRDVPGLADGLLDLRIEEDVEGLFACEVTFGNWGPKDGRTTFLYFDRSTLEFGKEFEVRIGTDSFFKGRITALEAQFREGSAPALAVLAEDRLQDLRMTRRTRTFENLSDSAIMQQVASEHGLSPDVNVSGPTHRVLAQLNQSDLAFLRERARAVDAELALVDGRLSARSHTQRNGGTIRLGYGNELREFRVAADLADQRSNVKVTGWDVGDKAALAETADDAALGGELKGGESGASILRTALSERKETVAHSIPLTSTEARARAESLFRRRARRFVRGRGVAQTDAKLRVGAYLKLEGLGPLFSGEYYVTEVRHVFDGVKGMRTEFTAERPGLGRPE